MASTARTLIKWSHTFRHDTHCVHAHAYALPGWNHDKLDPPRPADSICQFPRRKPSQGVASSWMHHNRLARCGCRTVRAPVARGRARAACARPDGALAPAGESAAGSRELVQRGAAGEVAGDSRPAGPVYTSLVKSPASCDVAAEPNLSGAQGPRRPPCLALILRGYALSTVSGQYWNCHNQFRRAVSNGYVNAC